MDPSDSQSTVNSRKKQIRGPVNEICRCSGCLFQSRGVRQECALAFVDGKPFNAHGETQSNGGMA